MNVLDWIRHLSRLGLDDLGSTCFILDELSGIVESEPTVTEYDVICEVADALYQKAEYAASLEDEKRLACTCGGNCKKPHYPVPLCLDCQHFKENTQSLDRSKYRWYRSIGNCEKSSFIMALECPNYEPIEGVKE